MKNLAVFILFSIGLFISCAPSTQFYNEPENDVRYLRTTISNVNRDLLTTASGDVWKVNGVLTGKQLSDIFFIFNLFEDYEGSAFINGVVYNVQSTQYDINPDGSERNTFNPLSRKYKDGTTTNFKFTNDNSIVELSNGNKYQVSFIDLAKIKRWKGNDIVILSEDENKLIHPVRIESVGIKKLK